LNSSGNQNGRSVVRAVPIVLFDGGCPLCAGEIAHYRRLSGADRLTWVDVSRERSLEARFGVTLAEAMARLHVRDAEGRWRTGAFAFAELWSHLPGCRRITTVLRNFRLLPLLDWLYERFAAWRLARRCRDGLCSAPAAGTRDLITHSRGDG
jgi:predicted DCC family thiol-disulfide oxidoreductase YuxK